jgi:hypothetical protein
MPRTKKRKLIRTSLAQSLWRAGKPITCDMLEAEGIIAPDKRKLEESKSIAYAMQQGCGFESVRNDDGSVRYHRLCDDCGASRGPMWVVDTDVWKAVMPTELWGADICLECWEERCEKSKNR